MTLEVIDVDRGTAVVGITGIVMLVELVIPWPLGTPAAVEIVPVSSAEV